MEKRRHIKDEIKANAHGIFAELQRAKHSLHYFSSGKRKKDSEDSLHVCSSRISKAGCRKGFSRKDTEVI